MNKLRHTLNRFKEPSTWAALAALSMLFGVKPETANAVLAGVGAIADAARALGVTPEDALKVVEHAPEVVLGAVAILLPEKTVK